MRLTFCVLLLLLLRKEFAVALGACWDEICQGHHSKGDKPIPSVAVFREQHAAGHPHYHAVMSAPRNSLWHHLERTLRSKYRVNGLIYYRYLADENDRPTWGARMKGGLSFALGAFSDLHLLPPHFFSS